MAKTKVSTIAIVVLSVLLAAAVAATIVLAAFSFTRSATTTISFASGLNLQASGITGTAWDSYALGNDGAKGAKLTTLTNITTGVALSKIQIKNPNAQTVTVAVAVVKNSALTAYVSTADTMTTATTLIDSTATSGLNYMTGGTVLAATSTKATSVKAWLTIEIAAGATVTVVNYIHTVFAPGAAGLDTLTGSFGGTFYIAAVYGAAGAATNSALQTAITEGEFVTTGFGAIA